MRIAHIVCSFPPHIGGMGGVCWNEAQLLSEKGHEVTVFTLKYPDTSYDDSIYDFPIERMSSLVKYGDAGVVPQVLWQIKNFDLVHLHFPFYGGAEWFCFKKIPMVVTYHMDAQPTGLKSLLQKAYDAVWPRFIFSKAKKVIVVDSEHFKTVRFGGLVKPENLIEIPNGVDVKLFKPMTVDLKDLELERLVDKKIILFVANLMPLKRLDLLLDALKILNDKNLCVLAVGGGYEEERYKKLAIDLGIDSQVIFAGPCGNLQLLSDFYNVATCLAVPSDYESFSLVVLEAMACGLPIVGSNIPSLKNRIEDGVDGLLFIKGSAADLADKLRKMLSMPEEELKKMGEMGRSKVVEKFSWENHIEKLEQVYKEVLNASGSVK